MHVYAKAHLCRVLLSLRRQHEYDYYDNELVAIILQELVEEEEVQHDYQKLLKELYSTQNQVRSIEEEMEAISFQLHASHDDSSVNTSSNTEHNGTDNDHLDDNDSDASTMSAHSSIAHACDTNSGDAMSEEKKAEMENLRANLLRLNEKKLKLHKSLQQKETCWLDFISTYKVEQQGDNITLAQQTLKSEMKQLKSILLQLVEDQSTLRDHLTVTGTHVHTYTHIYRAHVVLFVSKCEWTPILYCPIGIHAYLHLRAL